MTPDTSPRRSSIPRRVYPVPHTSGSIIGRMTESGGGGPSSAMVPRS
jgi:hypothetical protein